MFLLLLWFGYVVPDQYRAVMTHGFTIFEPGNPHWQMITGKPPEDQAKKPLILPTHPPTHTSSSSSDARFSRICLLNTYFEYSVQSQLFWWWWHPWDSPTVHWNTSKAIVSSSGSRDGEIHSWVAGCFTNQNKYWCPSYTFIFMCDIIQFCSIKWQRDLSSSSSQNFPFSLE